MKTSSKKIPLHRETLELVSNANWLDSFNSNCRSSLGWYLEAVFANLVDREGWLESEVVAAYLLKVFEEFNTGIEHALRNELISASTPELVDYFKYGFTYVGGSSLQYLEESKTLPCSVHDRNELAPDRMATPYAVNITFCGEPDETFNLECPSLEHAINECKALLDSVISMAYIDGMSGNETYLACKKVAKNISITPDSSGFDIEKYLKEESVGFYNEKYRDLQN
jgi:hypothetical protein